MSKRQPLSCDVVFIDTLKWLATERVKAGIDAKTESLRRLSKAVANLIMTDDEIKGRLINAILENDRRRNGYE